MPTVELSDITLAYPGSPPTLTAFDLYVPDGAFLALIGPSGSGKTTVVRVIAGLEQPAAGTVRIGGVDVTATQPHKRNLAMVFQDWALYPHLTAGKNIAFPMELRGDDPDAIARRVEEVARTVALGSQLERKPSELSAGHRHGVATGRALAGARPLLLMDEPLANLDAGRRRRVRLELARLQREAALTVVYATNDQEEAMALADVVAVLHGGALQQVGPPQQLYRKPCNAFVAGFVGSPAMNLLRAAIVEDRGGALLWLGSRSLVLTPADLSRVPGLRDLFGGEVVVGIRPEHMRYGRPTGEGPEQRIGGEVTQVEFLGSQQLVHFTNDAITAGGEAGAEWVARIAVDAPIRRGDHVALALDVERLCFFDPADGVAVAA